MKAVLHDARIFSNGVFRTESVLFSDGSLLSLHSVPADTAAALPVFSNLFVFPGFTDVHVHLREPGFSYKETIRTGTAAAAHGGYTTVCTMPNLNPVPDSPAHLAVQRALIEQDAAIRVLPYGSITVGELGEHAVDFAALRGLVVACSDDGMWVQNEALMEKAMREAAKNGILLSLHCEDRRTSDRFGCVSTSAYANEHHLPQITAESEWHAVARDIALAERTGCRIHICHISTKESVELVREAKRRSVDVSCETAPHYLLLDNTSLRDEGAYKMSPPLRSPRDREALLEAAADGVIDIIATDHAPHSREEKERGLRSSLFGIVSLDFAFSLLYTELVKTGKLSLERLLTMLTTAPDARFGISKQSDDCTLFDLTRPWTITEPSILSLGKSTPFLGRTVNGVCVATCCGGAIRWINPTYNTEEI